MWAFVWAGNWATIFGGGIYSVPTSRNVFLEAVSLK
jgi:hypothetical protein